MFQPTNKCYTISNTMIILLIVVLTFMYNSTNESWEQIKTVFENIDGKNPLLRERVGYGKTLIS